MELPIFGTRATIVVKNYSPAQTNPELAHTVPPTETYKGTIIKGPDWVYKLKGENFCIVLDDEPFPDRNPYRIVHMDNVISIDGLAQAGNESEIRSYEIAGSKGNTSYTVVIRGTSVSCNCPGFTFHGKCKHLDKALEQMIDDELLKG